MATTRQSAAAKKAAAAPIEPALDAAAFDAYDEESEAALLKSIGDELKPKFMIIEQSLAARFPDGLIVKVTLDVPFSTFQEMSADDKSPTEQIALLLDVLGQDKDREALERQGTTAVMAFAERYFRAWAKVVGVEQGESDGSSTN